MSRVRLSNGLSVTYRQEGQWVNYGPSKKPDPYWRYTDKAGHDHYVHYLVDTQYPTLTPNWVIGYCGLCNDLHEQGEILDHYACSQCGEKITPGTITVPGGQMFIPTYREYVLEGTMTVTDQEELNRLIASDAATSVSYGLGRAAQVTIRKLLTKEEAEALISSVS